MTVTLITCTHPIAWSVSRCMRFSVNYILHWQPSQARACISFRDSADTARLITVADVLHNSLSHTYTRVESRDATYHQPAKLQVYIRALQHILIKSVTSVYSLTRGHGVTFDTHSAAFQITALIIVCGHIRAVVQYGQRTREVADALMLSRFITRTRPVWGGGRAEANDDHCATV